MEFLKFTDTFKYRSTVRALAASIGGLLNYQELCSTTQSYFKELKRMISILSETYILSLVRPFFTNPRLHLFHIFILTSRLTFPLIDGTATSGKIHNPIRSFPKHLQLFPKGHLELFQWCGGWDLNPRHSGLQPDTLPG